MRILITNTSLAHRTGSELFVRDLALELLRRGNTPIVYSPRLGPLAEEIQRATIPVVNDLSSLGTTPDIIHGHHHLETMAALAHFKDVPAVFFCHGITPWQELPPKHPRIVRYAALSEAVRERMIYEYGIPEPRISMFSGFVDLERFKARPAPLPPTPKRALIFSNNATEANYAGLVRETCEKQGLAVDIIGLNYGTPTSTPETILGNYDIVFARGRAALESLAVGTAVICCDIEGVGSMVTTDNLDWFRRNNLGIRTLNRPHTIEILSEEILRYDALDAAKVSSRIRGTAGLTAAAGQILDIYQTALLDWSNADNKEALYPQEGQAMAAYLKWISELAPYKLTEVISARDQQIAVLTKELYDVHRAMQENKRALQDSNQALQESERALQDSNRALQNSNRALQDSNQALHRIRSTVTWKLYERITGISFIRSLYLLMAGLLRRREN